MYKWMIKDTGWQSIRRFIIPAECLDWRNSARNTNLESEDSLSIMTAWPSLGSSLALVSPGLVTHGRWRWRADISRNISAKSSQIFALLLPRPTDPLLAAMFVVRGRLAASLCCCWPLRCCCCCSCCCGEWRLVRVSVVSSFVEIMSSSLVSVNT